MTISHPTARNNAAALLRRIDVYESDVMLDRASGTARLWFHQKNGKEVEIRCNSQRTPSANLAAVVIWLKSRVINVERGIETLDNAFSGYLAIEGHTFAQEGVISEQKSIDKEYGVLDLSSNCSDIELKQRFLKLAGMYHPDRAMNGGTMNEVDILLHEKKMTELNQAYNKIKKARGIA